jgi:septal ring-binding cell division protein DamX
MNDRHQNDENSDNKAEQSEKSKSKSTIENLVHLSEKNIVSSSSDLNKRLQEIESELRHLNAREAATNKAFRELLSETKRHGSEQGAELEETRNQVSEIRETYKKLTRDYQRLAASSNILSVTLEQARSEITNDMETLRRSTQERVDQLADGQLQMIERANRIEQKAARMADDIDSRVNVIRATISALESRLADEIREMAAQSEQRDEALMIRTEMLGEELRNETDRLDKKLSAVEEESLNRYEMLTDRTDVMEARIDEDTATLYARTGELNDKAEDLQFLVNVIDSRASDLEERSDLLEEAAEKQSSRLAIVNETIDRHHKGFAIALVLIAVTLGILSILQQNRWLDTTASDTALQEKLAEQQSSMITQSAAQQENTRRIDQLENQSAESHDALSSIDEEILAAIDLQQQQIEQLQEKADNNASRMNALTPNRTFGQDNTIHNTAWLAQQDKQHYVVEVMSASTKQDLYAIAYRWSNLFNNSQLSAIQTQQNGRNVFTLVYGPFANMAQAEQISRRLPVLSFDSRPSVKKLAELF